jgi:hypothetical protein
VEAYSQEDNQASLAHTVGKIVADTQHLVRQEIELVKTEIKQEAKQGFKTAAGHAAAVALGAFGGVLLTVALIMLLTQAGLPFWLSCMVLAVIHLGAALAAFSWAKKEAKEIGKSFAEASTVESEGSVVGDVSQENVRWLKNQT